jgi:hypothetical protein
MRKKLFLPLAAAGLLGGATAAFAQLPNQVQGFEQAGSTVAISTTALLGIPLPMDRGPWVVGEAVFEGQKAVSPYALRNRIRARRGTLFTPTDVQSDVAEITKVPAVISAKAEVYGIPDQPVPDRYKAIAVSTMMVRIVYRIEEKPLYLPGLTRSTTAQAESSKKSAKAALPPIVVSGVVMTPTAYRGHDQYNRPGLGLDINTAYFIGRLYGKNSIALNESTNFLDRLGVVFLSADGKIQIQSEGKWRPAMSVGGRGTFTARDSPQPTVVTVQVSNDSTRILSDAYWVASKKIGPVRSSLGYALGDNGDRVSLLTEFLTEQALLFAGHPNQRATSKSTLFGSLMWLPHPNYPLAVEFIKPNGMALNPLLLNFKIGYFLKLNFDLSYLRFQGGWDLLGQFQFRYTHFPRSRPRAKRKR